jgi:hypothetical protein
MRYAGLMAAVMVVAMAGLAAAVPVIPDYDFMQVSGKNAVIPGPNPASGVLTLGVTNDGQYLAAQLYFGSYTQGIQFYDRSVVTPYDDYQSLNSAVGDVIGNNSNSVSGNATDNSGNPNANQSGNDARIGSAASATANFTTTRVWVSGRMTHDNYFIAASGSSSGPYRDWQPRELAAGANQNTYQINTTDSVGVLHSTSANSQWGASGNKVLDGCYVETLNPGHPTDEVIRGLSRSTTGNLGMFEVGPWQAPADTATQLGTRNIVSTRSFMTLAQVQGLVQNVNDVFRSWFSDGQYVFILTGGAGDNLSYLTAVEITDWDTGAWTQVEVASGGGMYQAFTFNSGDANTSLLDALGIAFAPNPEGGDPLLYLSDGRRIFVLEAVPEPATMGLLGLGFLPLCRRRRLRA